MTGSLRPFDFKGETYVKDRDGFRLNAQAQRVHDVFTDGNWHSLKEISEKTNDPEASISARIRDLRRWGFTMEKSHTGGGLWLYRMADYGNG